jgi:hypothetical protein
VKYSCGCEIRTAVVEGERWSELYQCPTHGPGGAEHRYPPYVESDDPLATVWILRDARTGAPVAEDERGKALYYDEQTAVLDGREVFGWPADEEQIAGLRAGRAS